MADQGRTVEQELARLGYEAHGIVTRSRLLSEGVTAAEIEHRLRTGALLREHREESGLDPEPVAAYHRSGYAEKIRTERVGGQAAGCYSLSAPNRLQLAATCRFVPGKRLHQGRSKNAG